MLCVDVNRHLSPIHPLTALAQNDQIKYATDQPTQHDDRAHSTTVTHPALTSTQPHINPFRHHRRSHSSHKRTKQPTTTPKSHLNKTHHTHPPPPPLNLIFLHTTHHTPLPLNPIFSQHNALPHQV
jgi:hypothetical protein